MKSFDEWARELARDLSENVSDSFSPEVGCPLPDLLEPPSGVCAKDYCEGCSHIKKELIFYRQRTDYPSEGSNWITLCPDCKKDNDDHWERMWNDYYSGCL